MIVLLLVHTLAILIGGLFTFLTAILPFQTQINSAFAYVIGPFKAMLVEIPYMMTVWYGFLSIIVFEITLMVVKLLLGSRTPRHIN